MGEDSGTGLGSVHVEVSRHQCCKVHTQVRDRANPHPDFVISS